MDNERERATRRDRVGLFGQTNFLHLRSRERQNIRAREWHHRTRREEDNNFDHSALVVASLVRELLRDASRKNELVCQLRPTFGAGVINLCVGLHSV